MATPERVSLIVGGAALGALSFAAYQKLNQPKPRPAAMVPVNNTRPPVPVSTPPSEQSVDARLNAKNILPFGVPTPPNDIVYRNAYVTSYNCRDRNPNWVAEHLTADSLKKADGVDCGKSSFKEDDTIPSQFRARLNDYYKSGFHCGHMVAAADVKNSQLKMDETFYLTNIAPQVGEGFNRDYWAHVETFCRSLTNNSTTCMCLRVLCICLTRNPTASFM
ncbi:unnamed protein product [Absidia cylindrospora]